MTGQKRPSQSEWYSPYFAPTTVIIAVTVLLLSVEAGKLVGGYYVQKDRASQVTSVVATAIPTTPLHSKPSASRTKPKH